MNEQLITVLKDKIKTLPNNINTDIIVNSVKEELHFYILNFIYHSPKYNKWIMYGGSALRVAHGLNRMSVDLDFEIADDVTDEFLRELKEDIEKYFLDIYEVNKDILDVKIKKGRGILLKFDICKELNINYPSNQIYVKIDLNHFISKHAVTEYYPENHNQFVFTILIYNLPTLMASKLSAVFLRKERGIGKFVYNEKGRDIYDLLWYMNKKIIPNFGYMIDRDINIKDINTLINRLTIQMDKVSDKNLIEDLSYLFLNPTYAKDWVSSWKQTYLMLKKEYNAKEIDRLDRVDVYYNPDVPSFYSYNFIYHFLTKNNDNFEVYINVSEDTFDLIDPDISYNEYKKIIGKVFLNYDVKRKKGTEKANKYAFILYNKIEEYFNKNNNIVLGNSIITKLIRSKADNFNPREEIIVNKSTLLSYKLDDMLI